MEAKLLLIPWMAAVIYSSIPLFWFAIHPFAERWRKMNRSPYRALLPLWMLIIAGIGWCTWPWHSQRIYSTFWTWIPALVFFFLGFRVYRRISSEFGTHKFSGEAELRPGEHPQQLVTTGLHTRLRHPIYFAHLCNLAGWAVGSGLMMDYVLLALNMLVTFPVMIYMEERELESRFGDAFRVYKDRVPLVPRFTHLRARFSGSNVNGREVPRKLHDQTHRR